MDFNNLNNQFEDWENMDQEFKDIELQKIEDHEYVSHCEMIWNDIKSLGMNMWLRRSIQYFGLPRTGEILRYLLRYTESLEEYEWCHNIVHTLGSIGIEDKSPKQDKEVYNVYTF